MTSFYEEFKSFLYMISEWKSWSEQIHYVIAGSFNPMIDESRSIIRITSCFWLSADWTILAASTKIWCPYLLKDEGFPEHIVTKHSTIGHIID